MEIVYIISSLIFGGIAYYSIKRLNSRRFRIVEKSYYSCPIDTSNKRSSFYPQVKINGVWFYLHGASTPYIDPRYPNEFIDVQDALELIDKFKSAGNFSIPSNKKLNRNQKAIKVE